jgi:DNA-binding PadR family transcriptional regulator
MSPSQIYAVLKRLEDQGLIRGRALRGRQAPDRVVYAVRAPGRRRMLSWLEDPEPSASVRAIRVEFLSRLYVAERLGVAIAPIIAAQTSACQRQQQALRGALERATSLTERRSLSFVLSQLSAAIVWLENLAAAATAEAKA